jgi:uncharacterized protein (TIGR03066 family)
MNAKARKAQKAARQTQHHDAGQRRSFRMPRWVIILTVVALVAGGSFAAFEFLLPGRIPPELVGHWRVVGGPMDGTIMEFRRSGTMIGKATIDGKDGIIEGTAEVVGNTLRTMTINPFSGRAETGTQTIVTLSESEFVTEDSNGSKVRMTRLRD